MNRRDFIQKSAALLALSAGRRYQAEAADLPPKRVGLIGCGWYGKSDVFRLVQVSPVEIVSLCDVDKKMLADCAEMAAARQAAKKKPRIFTDYREMLKEKDLDLVEIAKRRPSSRGELEKIRGVGSSASGRRAEELLEAVRVGREQPPDPPGETIRPPAPKPDDAPLVALGEALLRTRAREAGLAYELLAARADLQAIVTATRIGGEEADVRTLRGWRRELAGAELLELLNGGVALSIQQTNEGRRVRISNKPE
jgi:ribonuclease D